jgi:hypothetical protein
MIAQKETIMQQLERLTKEREVRQRPEERIKTNLQWEDWETLLPELVAFAKQEIMRRRWRGGRSEVLPEGYDANSVASEVIAAALRGKSRLVLGWTRERLMRELSRMVSNEVRRLHKLQETKKMRSEWEVLSLDANGEARSVFAPMRATTSGGSLHDTELLARKKARAEAELKIATALRGGDEMVEKLFHCLRDGVVKRQEIAARLGMSVPGVTNCRKRLDRRLEELEKEAGIPEWVIAEWKGK